MTTSPVDELKRAAAEAAARRVRSGMVVGLGTGSTAIHAVAYLGRRCAKATYATSAASPLLPVHDARSRAGHPLVGLDEIERIDVAIDGADEVAPDRR
jgi:ribose 5-phosphate isomerase A